MEPAVSGEQLNNSDRTVQTPTHSCCSGKTWYMQGESIAAAFEAAGNKSADLPCPLWILFKASYLVLLLS